MTFDDSSDDLAGATLCEQDWERLLAAADAAGRHAARRMAARHTLRELGRTGRIRVRIGPGESPLAAWLVRSSRGHFDDGGSAVLEVDSASAGSTPESATKSRSLLVRKAYADAFCTVLTEEAGAIADVWVEPDQLPFQRHSTPTRAVDEPQAAETRRKTIRET